MFSTLKSATLHGEKASLALRSSASGAHLLLSMVVAASAFALVYFVWFPREYWLMAGGRELFFLIVSVDVVLGPLVTFAVFNPAKGLGRLKFDLVVIAALQLGALGYGLWTVSAARPIFMVFNVDRFSLVTAIALDPADQALAERPEFRSSPFAGPVLVGSRLVANQEEQLKLMSDAVAGKDVELQPKFYVPFAEVRPRVAARAKAVNVLRTKTPESKRTVLDRALQELGLPDSDVFWLPVMARGDWVVLLDAKTHLPLRYVPLDGF